eukprot:scaffold510_cov141-Skeletonema_marinoi.AAC.4
MLTYCVRGSQFGVHGSRFAVRGSRFAVGIRAVYSDLLNHLRTHVVYCHVAMIRSPPISLIH